MKYSLRSLMIVIALLAIALAYVGSYVRRSSVGMYKPAVIGLGWVKWYDWAPDGFVDGYRWNATTVRFYYPLWRMDRRFWHRPVHSGAETPYPIDEVSSENIDSVYRAWEENDPLPTSQAPAPNPPQP